MKGWVKKAGIRLLSSPPFYPVLRAMALRDAPTTILCYHTLRPTSETLDAWTALRLGDFFDQIKTLRQHYEIVSLAMALERQGMASRPRAVLTFDDGELGLYQHLLPLVAAEKLPVTVYVATSQIEQGTPYWFDRVMNALQGEGTVRIDLSTEGLTEWQVGPSRGQNRWTQISAILEALKTVPPAERDRLADLVVAQTDMQTDGFTPLQPMTIAQLKELAASPFVTIGAHSHGHELLDQLPLKAALASIAQSKTCLESWTGKEVSDFAYPNGNYSPELMIEIEKLGFVSATILDDRLASFRASPFALSRIGVGRYDTSRRLSLRLIGLGLPRLRSTHELV